MTLEQTLTNKVAEMCKLAGVPVLIPDFSLTGRIAGQFCSRGKDMNIRLNLEMARANDGFIDRTPRHEVAHYARYIRNGYKLDRQRNGRRDMHGAKWKVVMAELGAEDISRCHRFTVPNKKVYKKFGYQCECGQSYELTAIRHNRLVKDARRYMCHQCSGDLIFVGEVK